MTKPRLKKFMSTFVGCAVNELRLSCLKSCREVNTYLSLADNGYLTVRENGKYLDFALTEKGKAHVVPLERYYAII